MRPVASWICACRQPTVRAVRRDARLRGREDTFRRRVLIGACLGGAALLLALLACEAFGSAPPPEAQVRPLSFWRQVRRHTSETFGFVFFFAPLVAVWGFSVHIRCSERLIRRPLKTVAVLVVLWLVVVLVKYRCVTQSQQLVALLWYLYYVPMTLIPLLCLVCAFRAAGIDHLRPVCVFEKALVAASVKADLLVLLSDIDGLYTADPRTHADAALIPEVAELTPAILAAAGCRGSALGTGGMATKLTAASLCMEAGVDMIIMNGSRPAALYDVLAGEAVGTRFIGRK